MAAFKVRKHFKAAGYSNLHTHPLTHSLTHCLTTVAMLKAKGSIVYTATISQNRKLSGSLVNTW